MTEEDIKNKNLVLIDYLRSIRIVGDNNSIQVSQCVNGISIKAIQNYKNSNLTKYYFFAFLRKK